jgi:hypothetical protein
MHVGVARKQRQKTTQVGEDGGGGGVQRENVKKGV